MPKMKTHKGVKKRFRATAKGKIKHRRAGTSHLNSRMTQKRSRHLRRTGVQQQLDDIRADEACAAGNEARGAGKHALRVKGFDGFTRHDWSPKREQEGRAARPRCGAAARA